LSKEGRTRQSLANSWGVGARRVEFFFISLSDSTTTTTPEIKKKKLELDRKQSVRDPLFSSLASCNSLSFTLRPATSRKTGLCNKVTRHSSSAKFIKAGGGQSGCVCTKEGGRRGIIRAFSFI
jgi:hypothetical protein